MRRAWTTLGVAALLVVGWQSPAAAHGQGHGDLPIADWQVLYAAAVAVAATGLALRAWAPGPVLAAASHGRPLPRWADRATSGAGVVLRIAGVVLWAVALSAAWFGTDNAADNLAPALVYVLLWVGMPVLSAVMGDVWRALSPFDTFVGAAERLRPRPRPPSSAADAPGAGAWSHRPAAAGVLAFTWLELCYHSPNEPRVLALAITAYSVAVIATALRRGRAWLRDGEMFAVLFGLFAAMSPFFRDDERRLRARLPLSGLASVGVRRGTPAVLCVLIASAGFDGLRTTHWWTEVIGDRTGWGRTLLDTMGLLGAVAIVAVACFATVQATARTTGQPRRAVASWLTPALVPVALGFLVGRYLTFFAVEVQGAIANLSDPYGEGWDLFGTATNVVDLDVVSATTAAWVLVVAVVVAHVAAVWIARDLATTRTPSPDTSARTGQVPLTVVLIASATAGLALLL